MTTARRLLGLTASILTLCCAGAAGAQTWKPGQIVLGSPAAIPTGFNRCVVMGGPNSNGYWDLECAQWRLDASGKKVRALHRTWVNGAWIKPNDPAFEPDMQVAAIKAAQAKPASPAAAPKSEAGQTLKLGAYQCTGYSAGNMKLSFRSATQYANEQGTVGAYTKAGPLITFVSGPWKGFYGYLYENGSVQLRTAPDRPGYMTCQLR